VLWKLRFQSCEECVMFSVRIIWYRTVILHFKQKQKTETIEKWKSESSEYISWIWEYACSMNLHFLLFAMNEHHIVGLTLLNELHYSFCIGVSRKRQTLHLTFHFQFCFFIDFYNLINKKKKEDIGRDKENENEFIQIDKMYVVCMNVR
jgi:hypothetical protein